MKCACEIRPYGAVVDSNGSERIQLSISRGLAKEVVVSPQIHMRGSL